MPNWDNRFRPVWCLAWCLSVWCSCVREMRETRGQGKHFSPSHVLFISMARFTQNCGSCVLHFVFIFVSLLCEWILFHTCKNSHVGLSDPFLHSGRLWRNGDVRQFGIFGIFVFGLQEFVCVFPASECLKITAHIKRHELWPEASLQAQPAEKDPKRPSTDSQDRSKIFFFFSF